MKNIIIIGAGLGLNSCQMLRLQTESLRLKEYGIILVDHLHELSDLSKPKVEDLANVIKVFEDKSIPMHNILIAEKNFKYNEQKTMRQQHKWAQRNYKRK